ncbi:MAG: FadR family transcriptional regulator, partial [Lachnospiraceae bacterium]|nr:FadR family transcriptional regulator [Lachnospiraceae bacterium]
MVYEEAGVTNVEKIKSVKLYEQVMNQLASQIENGIYKKGEFLPSEKELIELTGVSRVTIREALRILNDMGYIETLQGKGSRVILEHIPVVENYTEKELVDFQVHRMNHEMANQVRLIMEPEVARMAAQMAAEEDIQNIREVLEAPDKGSLNQVRDFHRAIIQCVQIPYLLDIYDDMIQLEREHGWFGEVIPAQRPETRAILQEQHQKIFDAICQGNGEFAYFYMKEHQTFILQNCRQYFDGLSERYFSGKVVSQ